MTKAPTPAEMSKGQSDNINNTTKKFDKTAVADRLRTVSWINYGHPTGAINLVYGPLRFKDLFGTLFQLKVVFKLSTHPLKSADEFMCI